MPVPFLSLLPSTARLAYPFVLSGVKRGLSSRAIEQTIRSAGLRISRSGSILPMMRRLKAIELAGRNIRFIGKRNTINVNKLPESITRLRRAYSYNVRVQGADSFGNPIDRFVTVSTDNNQLSPGDIETAAEDLVGLDGQSGHVIDATATIQEGTRQSTITSPL